MLKLSEDWTGPVFEFDPDSTPQCQINAMSETILHEARLFFEQPGTREKYQEWLKAREAKKPHDRIEE